MDNNRILRRPEVERIVGLSRSSLYSMMSDGEFPRPIRLGKRAVGWPAESTIAWLNSRTDKSA